MLWWIVGALVAVPLLVVLLAALALRRRQLRLLQLATRAAEQGTARAAALEPAQQRLQAQLAALAQRATLAQHRAELLNRRLARLRR